MAIAEVIKYEGPSDALVWKYPLEDFNATSKLIVDPTLEALLIVNGNAADLFLPGERSLSLPNIPIARKLIEIPTSGKSPFNCKVFFINKVHQMNLRWGLINQFTLEDPIYDILLHVSANGSINLSVKDSRKFVLKCVGIGDQFKSEELISQPNGKFSSQISMIVQDCLSKVMIKGQISYFVITQELAALSKIIRELLEPFFDDYGLQVDFFNINTVTVPDNDFAKVNEAKDLRASRYIEGYTWQEERQAKIMETFAGNSGAAGATSGAMGGLMVGGIMGGSFSEIAKSVLNPGEQPVVKPPSHPGEHVHVADAPNGINLEEFFAPEKDSSRNTGGEKIDNNIMLEDKNNICPSCGAKLPASAKFCFECGICIVTKCSNCGADLPAGAKFCMECGAKI